MSWVIKVKNMKIKQMEMKESNWWGRNGLRNEPEEGVIEKGNRRKRQGILR